MDCSNCGKAPHAVPYIVYESSEARHERDRVRFWITILVLVFLLVGTNIGWIIYESQFEDVITQTQEVEQEVDGEGYNQFIGGDLIGN